MIKDDVINDILSCPVVRQQLSDFIRKFESYGRGYYQVIITRNCTKSISSNLSNDIMMCLQCSPLQHGGIVTFVTTCSAKADQLAISFQVLLVDFDFISVLRFWSFVLLKLTVRDGERVCPLSVVVWKGTRRDICSPPSGLQIYFWKV